VADCKQYGNSQVPFGSGRLFADEKGVGPQRRRPPRRKQETPPVLNGSEALLRLPYIGELQRCNENGFAFFSSRPDDLFVHIHDNIGKPLDDMGGHDGRLCAYVVGGHPFRYSNDKQHWDVSPVQWMFVDNIGDGIDKANYANLRRQALEELSPAALREALNADWYRDLWKRKTGRAPEAPLKADSTLNAVVHEALMKSPDMGELLQLLETALGSPWYGCGRGSTKPALKEAVRPDEWPLEIFANSQPGFGYQGVSRSLELYGEMLQERAEQTRLVSIDLEGDKEKVVQYGWKNALGTELRENRDGLTDNDLIAAVEESIISPQGTLFIGHNIIKWDLPILLSHGVTLPAETKAWDTLLAAWLLEPWKRSHALIVAEDAHRADADAATAFALAEKQIGRFTRGLSRRPTSIHSLVDHLYEHPEAMSAIGDRVYPDIETEYAGKSLLIPTERLRDFNWKSGYYLCVASPEHRTCDPVLKPEVCRLIAETNGAITTKMICIIVADANQHGVVVRLSMLPRWLTGDELSLELRKAHVDSSSNPAEQDSLVRVSDDLFSLSKEEVLSILVDPQLTVLFPEAVLADWQSAYTERLTAKEVETRFPGLVKNAAKRSLYPATDQSGDTRWLLYEPGGAKEHAPHWHVLPERLAIEGGDLLSDKSSDIRDVSAVLPRWRDGAALSLDVDRLFISPDTANRPLYLADMVHIILNLVQEIPEDEVLLVAMRSASEAEELQNNLARLSLTPLHSSSPLRQLERVVKEGQQIQVCSIEKLPAYLDAAGEDSLNVEIQVAVSELPLHRWHAMLHDPEPVDAAESTETDFDESGLEEDEEDSAGSVSEIVVPSMGVPLSFQNIYECTGVFLDAWVRFITQRDNDSKKRVMVLDQRISPRQASRFAGLQSLNVAFFDLPELLDQETLKIYNQVCFPKKEEKYIPGTYRDYQAFLKQNWKYDDFKAGTQQPAINALLADRRDMLLRLPTGEGKSIIFHLPALLRGSHSGKLSVVITPLRALMHDQVQGLWRRHFIESVDYLSGGRDAWLNSEVYQGVLDGRVKLLFAAPERFRIPRFIDALERRRLMDGGLEFVVFDEAHCVSQWGFEFRPDYLYAAQYVSEWFKTKELPGNPHRLLLTSATVTKNNQEDLQRELQLKQGEYHDLPENMPHPIQDFIRLESFDIPGADEMEKLAIRLRQIQTILATFELKQSAVVIFVRRRVDCHMISEALNSYAARPDSNLAGLVALPFHAGLAETLKTEAVHLLKARTINVLVCTKAFGMGMDIPHLHACIHSRPPTYIEDYLQEVGRIGRDEGEREKSGHKEVVASLLYDQGDLEKNLSQLIENTVQPANLQDFFNYCLSEAPRCEQGGEMVCFVNSTIKIHEQKELKDTRVSSSLFWLERMKVLKLEGRYPPFVNIMIDVQLLRAAAGSSTLTARLAAAILSSVDETSRVLSQSVPAKRRQEEEAHTDGFRRFVRGLVRGVLALISEPIQSSGDGHAAEAAVKVELVGDDPRQIKASIAISHLISALGGIEVDDFYEGLHDLTKARVLYVNKSFLIRKRERQSRPGFWDLLDRTVDKLIADTGGRATVVDRDEFEDECRSWYQERLIEVDSAGSEDDLSDAALSRIERIAKWDAYRSVSSALRIVRYAGLEIRETISSEGVTQYAWVVPKTSHAQFSRAVQARLATLRKTVAWLNEEDPSGEHDDPQVFQVPLFEFMEAVGPDVRMSELKRIVTLVESSGFFGFEDTEDDWVSIVTVSRKDALPPYTVEPNDASLDGVPSDSNDELIHATYVEMVLKFELQKVRAQCMQLLALMPEEGRKAFIDKYFEATGCENLKALIENTVGDIGDARLDEFPGLMQLMNQVRQKRFDDEMVGLNPEQESVCMASYASNLLVNAGPGSGKTHVLMMRCAHLIHRQGITPAEILVLSFNRAVVAEIRERIRELFHDLGYGSYVNRLDVSTFHSFALRHQDDTELFEDDAISHAVHHFANRMWDEPDFVQEIAGSYKAVLVDEFQDMNEDFYRVVRRLTENCSGGTMVIGDDDQDILTWNRCKWEKDHRETCPKEAVHYFRSFKETFALQEYKLKLNYRSVPEIVARAEGMIAKVSGIIGFTRMKSDTKLEAHREGAGLVSNFADTKDCVELIKDAFEYLADDEQVRERDGRGASVALLCRSNKECRAWNKMLVEQAKVDLPRVDMLGSEDFGLYQLRPTGAIQDLCRKRDGYEFVESYTWELLIEEYRTLGHADAELQIPYLNSVYEMAAREKGRPRIRNLVNFIQEMRTSDVDRLEGKHGHRNQSNRLVISTVHKVKGLQFDAVIILPSDASFPFMTGNTGKVDAIDSAEEARLYYVAMTRARNRLYMGWGRREKAWYMKKHLDAANPNSHACVLEGKPTDTYVSWPGQKDNVNSKLQEYLTQNVSIGDPLKFRGNTLLHNGREIIVLSKKANDARKQVGAPPFARVSNIIRYACGPYFKKHQPRLWDELHPAVKKRGWFFTVIPEEYGA